jgi:hypothetical protein
MQIGGKLAPLTGRCVWPSLLEEASAHTATAPYSGEEASA